MPIKDLDLMTLRFQSSIEVTAELNSVNFGEPDAHRNTKSANLKNTSQSANENSTRDSTQATRGGKESIEDQLVLDDLGNVAITDKAGHVLPAERVKALCVQNDSTIKKWLENQAAKINQELALVLSVHLDTPDPDSEIVYLAQPLDTPVLHIPKLNPLGLMGRLFKSKRKIIEQENLAILQQHNHGFEERDSAWLADVRNKEKLRDLIDRAQQLDIQAMQELLTLRLNDLQWPLATNINFDITSLSEVFIDVKFPDIGALPTAHAEIAKRGYKLNFKIFSDTQNRNNFAEHIHAIGFRIIGECFHTLPTLKRATLSGYSQHGVTDNTVRDPQYFYSVSVDRAQWRNIDFNNLYSLAPLNLFDQFILRRNATKTWAFKPIAPFGPETSQHNGAV